MPYGISKVNQKPCAKVEPPHPCDVAPVCDPFFIGSDCPPPYICHERLKNPAFVGEITTCRSGSFMKVKSCKKAETVSEGGTHPCDPLKPCSVVNKENEKKTECADTPICTERIKNPRRALIVEPCDPTK